MSWFTDLFTSALWPFIVFLLSVAYYLLSPSPQARARAHSQTPGDRSRAGSQIPIDPGAATVPTVPETPNSEAIRPKSRLTVLGHSVNFFSCDQLDEKLKNLEEEPVPQDSQLFHSTPNDAPPPAAPANEGRLLTSVVNLLQGRNLLNKKEAPPSTIKEGSESSQTIDDSDAEKGSHGGCGGGGEGETRADGCGGIGGNSSGVSGPSGKCPADCPVTCHCGTGAGLDDPRA